VKRDPFPPPPPSDPRDQPVAVKPSAFYTPEMPTEEQWEILAAQDGLYVLIQKYGARRVSAWVRNLAAIHGQDIDRPADRCLADGAALVNQICVKCGRDNS
jgi:hypothetical protein